MIVFCNSNGDIFHVSMEQIYQGSAGKNDLYFIGAFASTNLVMASFRLPDGSVTLPYLLEHVQELEDVTEDGTKAKYNVWRVVLGEKYVKNDDGEIEVKPDYSLLSQSGELTVQFSVYDGDSRKSVVLCTAQTTFTIQKGVPFIIDREEIQTPKVQDLLTRIFNAIASWGEAIENKVDRINKTGLWAYTHKNGEDGATPIQQSTTPRTIPIRDEMGGVSVATDINKQTNAVNVCVMQNELKKKVDKMGDTSGTEHAYAHKGTEDISIVIDENANPKTIVKRTQDGRIKTPEPQEVDEATNKGYVNRLFNMAELVGNKRQFFNEADINPSLYWSTYAVMQAIKSITGDLSALEKPSSTLVEAINKIKVKNFEFVGVVATTLELGAYKDGTYLYVNDKMPTNFPIYVKIVDHSKPFSDWLGKKYTPELLDVWKDLNSDKEYYWDGDEWNAFDPDIKAIAVDNITIGLDAQGKIYVRNGAISTAQLQDEAVTQNKMAVNSVGEMQIKDGSITTEKIADGAVSQGDIQDGAVTNEKIRESTITVDKFDETAVVTSESEQGISKDDDERIPTSGAVYKAISDITGQAVQILAEMPDPDSYDSPNVFIFDDVLYYRTGGQPTPPKP